MRKNFESAGEKVIGEASNGEDAVRLAQNLRPDVVVMDISMPVMDGKAATREIRGIEAGTGGHVPIVALTAHASAEDAEDILASGVDHYMTKPIRKAALHDMIRRLCPGMQGEGRTAAE